MTIEQANVLSQEEFVAELGWVCEHSPWVAERAWHQRPFASLEALHQSMTAAMESASREEQLALLCAHPELGSRAPMGAASTAEQAGVFGGGGSVPAEMIQHYRRKFGFPFIFAVKGSSPADIAVALQIRMDASAEDEFRQALWEVSRIAWFRLQDKFKEI